MSTRQLYRATACCLVVWLGGSAPAEAQSRLQALLNAPHKEEDRPRLFINAPGPTGKVLAAEFTADGRTLLAAGEDKAVHMWTLRQQGERPGLVYSGALRWEIARGLRGAVYAIAAHPRRSLVAIGGYGSRGWAGDVILIDSVQQRVVRALPPQRVTGRRDGHQAPVVSLDFSPDGQTLVSASRDGEVRLWRSPDWTSRQLTPPLPNGEAVDRCPVKFLSNLLVAVPVPTRGAGGTWSVALFDSTSLKQVASHRHLGQITAIAAEGERWASADSSGALRLWRGGAKSVQANVRQGAIVRGLSFGGPWLAASTDYQGPGQNAKIEIYDAQSLQLRQDLDVSTRTAAPCVDVSADARHIVYYDPDRHALTIANLAQPSNGQAAVVLDRQRMTRAQTRGFAPSRIAFSTAANYRLALFSAGPAQHAENALAERPVFSFDYSETSRLRPDEMAGESWRRDSVNLSDQWSAASDGAPGWSARVVKTAAGQSFTVEVQAPKRNVRKIQFEASLQGTPAVLCWLHSQNREPYAVAIGSAAVGGVFVYDLRDKPTPTLARYFRDHHGAIVSLAASSDGRYLASAATDRTVKLWSLEGLAAAGNRSRTAVAWGANYQIRNGALIVSDVAANGITAGRGLKEGDKIVEVSVLAEGRQVFLTRPEQMEDAINNLPLYQQIVILAERGGQPLKPIVMAPAWEPLLTLFADTREDWAAWTPQGPYEASVAEGSELFGWQINGATISDTPRILKAEELRGEFEKPEVLRELLKEGSLSAAIRRVQRRDGAPAGAESVTAIANQLPEVRITGPVGDPPPVVGREATWSAEIVWPGEQAAAEFTVRASINGRALPPPRRKLNGRREQLDWTAAASEPVNRFVVRVEESSPREGRDLGLLRTAEAIVHARLEQSVSRTYRLHVLAIAVDQYSSSSFSPLKCAVNDAKAFIAALNRNAGPHYQIASVDHRFDREVTVDGVKQCFAEARSRLQNAGPDDVLLIYLAGHGHAEGYHYYFIPPDLQAESRAELRRSLDRQAIPWSAFTSLGDLPCRKLIFLDTCRSGNAVLADEAAQSEAMRTSLKASSAPLRRHDFMTIMATEIDEPALEGMLDFKEHGAFTNFILLALDGQPYAGPTAEQGPDHLTPDGILSGAAPDGNISIMEMAEFAKQAVPRATRGLQHPTFTPRQLFEDVNPIELTRVRVDYASSSGSPRGR